MPTASDELYICWLSVLGKSLNCSAGDVDWMSGLADDYLSLDDRVSLEGRQGFDWENPDTCMMNKLDHKWLSPYLVDQVILWSAY